MADMGAEVIKVERPTGDPERFAPDAIRKGGVEVLFLHCNGGKKSVCIDLKQPRGPELFRSLASQVDVVVENYTPQVLAGYGLDYQSLRQVNPGVVMLSTTGYGQQGLDGNPRLPCTDPVAQAMGGLSNITGERDGAPYTIGGAIGDSITAIQGAMAVGYALYHRQRTGVGQHIDLSMIEGCLFADSLVMPHVAATKGENIYFRNGKQNTYSFPMGVLKSKEGYLVIHADGEGPESPWARLCGAIGRRDMIEDPRYASPRARVERTQEVIDILEGWLQTVSDDEAALTVLAEARDLPPIGVPQIMRH